MIIVDVEIEKAIQGRGEERLPEIEYCQGWRDFAGMGISVVCTYDILTHLTRVFLKEDLGELSGYLDGKWTAGFNTKRFDLPLLAEHGIDVDPGQHYDILEEIWIALGLNPDKFYYKTHGGWGLDAVCQATLGIAKTGHGALAPVWWQQGKRGKVIDYCCNDVWMEGALLTHVLSGNTVRNGQGDGADHELKLSRPLALQYPAFYVREALQERAERDPEAPEGMAVSPGGLGIMSMDTATDPPTVYTSPGGLGIIR